MRQLLLASALTLLPLAAMAEDSPAEIAIEAREGYMQMLGMNMGKLAGMAKGDIAYDAAAASTAAANIEALSQYDLSGLFIEGSAPADGVDTEALPAIWENSAGFTEKVALLREAAAGAGEAVAGGQDSIGPVLQKLGGACKACHDDFRKK